MVEANRPALRPARGCRDGFRNLLTKENGEWLSGRKWLAHAATWLSVVAGAPALVAFVGASRGGSPDEVNELGALVFFVVGQVAGVIAVVVRTQGAIVRERRDGTAEWVLSKPVSREAFLLSKLVAHLWWLALLTLSLPAVAFYLCMPAISGLPLPPVRFVGGVGMAALSLLFYLALSLLLGTVFDSRGPIAGIVFGFAVAGFALAHFDVPEPATSIFPWLLFEFGRFLIAGDQLPATAFISIGASATWSVMFMALALWVFRRKEEL